MKRAQLIFMFLLIIGYATGEVYTIGNGTSIQSNLPYNGTTSYGWSKVLYTASELSASGLPAGLIAGIGYQLAFSGNPSVVYNQQIYIRNTTASAYLHSDLSLPNVSGFQYIYSGSYSWSSSSWNNITFTSPFLWDGVSSIEILWENRDGYGTTNPPQFYSSATSYAMGVMKHSSFTFPSDLPGEFCYYRPNIQFNTEEASIPSPANIIAPANGQHAMLSTVLRWSAGTGMPSSYKVYFGTNPNPPLVVNQSNNYYQPDALLQGTTYYWKVEPENSLGTAPNCPIWSFITPSANQLVQSFEGSFPPAAWATQGSNWGTSTSFSTDGAAALWGYGTHLSQSIISTPKVVLSTGSKLSFDLYSLHTSTTVEIVYSSDRQTWYLLQYITTNEGNTWERKFIDMLSITGNYYLGFRTTLETGHFYIDSVIGPQLLNQLPGMPQQPMPGQWASNVSIYPIFTWQSPTTGGIPTGYNVYLDAGDNPSTLIGTVTGNIFMLNTALEYGTNYTWKVAAFNDAGEGPSTSVLNFVTMNDITVRTFPWLEDFGTVASDWPVQNWTQLKGFFPNPASAQSQWSRDDWVNVPAVNNNAARMNVFGTDRCGWLITPPIELPPVDFELQFSLGLTDYTQPSPIEDPNAQQDDRFIVMMSDSRNMANPVILREWNNTTSDYIYNQIPHTGLVSSISLSGITGVKYFAFYGESSQPGGDNDLYVDNVTIRRVATEGHLATNPQVCNFNQVNINNSSNISIQMLNNGVSLLSIRSIEVAGVYFSLSEPFAELSLGMDESASIVLNYSPLTAGEHNGTITFYWNNTSTVLPINGYCHDPIISVFPWIENFNNESGLWPAIDWKQYYGQFPNPMSPFNAWVQDDWLNQPALQEKAARIHVNSANYNAWLVTPGVNIDSDDYQLSFDIALMMQNTSNQILNPEVSGTERFIVLVGNTDTLSSYTILREWNNTGSAYRFNDIPNLGTTVTLPLNGFGWINYFAFYLECDGGGTGNFGDLMIDNVRIATPSSVHDTDNPEVPRTALKANYPNPFNPQTTISYSMKASGMAEIGVYNLKGQLIKKLLKSNQLAGEHTLVWDGRDDNGNLVSSGIYLCNLRANGVNESRKIILSK